MNRRTKERLDLRLLCRIGPAKVLSALDSPAQSIGLTQNLSRSGLLMRWLDTVTLPEVGSSLVVDIELPADTSFGPRLMRCRTTVVRIIEAPAELPTVGMKIRNIRFVAPDPTPKKVAASAPTVWELESMPTATERLN
jgi:hypothetical protein